MSERRSARDLPDTEVLEMIKASGILNQDITLDQLMELAEQVGVGTGFSAAFIFKHFLYRPC